MGGARVLVCLLLGLAVGALDVSADTSSLGTLYLTIAYTPDLVSNAGAIVSVDVPSGKWSIVGLFKWPDSLDDDPYFFDPAYYHDHARGLLYLNFQTELGLMCVLNVVDGSLVSCFDHSDPFFVGFQNFAVNAANTLALGTSPVGTADGQGTYSFGRLDLRTKVYLNQTLLWFRAVMDDSALFDEPNDRYYIQASYDQRANAVCPGGEELCFLTIEASSGKLLSTVKSPFTVYKYYQARTSRRAASSSSSSASSSSSSSVLAWLEGFDSFCNDADNDFLFGIVDLDTGSGRPLACVPQTAVIQEAPWIADFSADGTLLATGSRYDQQTQLLVFTTSSGAVVLNSTLAGLSQQLKSADGFYYIWGLAWSN